MSMVFELVRKLQLSKYMSCKNLSIVYEISLDKRQKIWYNKAYRIRSYFRNN